MDSRRERKELEEKQLKTERKENRRNKIKGRIEEFKLNRQGKTNKKRADVMSKYRKTERILTALIVIVSLLLVIAWVIVLYY